MTGANHQWGYLIQAPFNGLWCGKCGCAEAGKNALQDCPVAIGPIKVQGWTADEVVAAEAKQRFVDAQLNAQVSASPKQQSVAAGQQ